MGRTAHCCHRPERDARWDCRGIAGGLLRDCRGIAVGLPWDCRGIAVGLPWDCRGIAVGLPCDCRGIAVALPWHCCGIAVVLVIAPIASVPRSRFGLRAGGLDARQASSIKEVLC